MAAPNEFCHICKWWSDLTNTCDYCYLNGCSRHPEISPCIKFTTKHKLTWIPKFDELLTDAYFDGASDNDLRAIAHCNNTRILTWRAYHGYPRNDARKREDTYE